MSADALPSSSSSPESPLWKEVAGVNRSFQHFQAYIGTHSDPQSAYAQANALLFRLTHTLRSLELAGVEPKQIREHCGPARTILHQSRFLSHLEFWPLGYPGDFEAMEWMNSGHNQSPFRSPEFYLEEACLHASFSQRHTARLQTQNELVLETMFRRGNEAKILSISGGSVPDLYAALRAAPIARPKVVLNDIDERAFRLATTRLKPYVENLQTITGNVVRSAAQIEALGPFDLVILGPLLDYLDDRSAVTVLRLAAACMGPFGRMSFSNTIKGHYCRPFLEYAVSWKVYERDEADLRRLAQEAGIRFSRLRVTPCKTHVALQAVVVSDFD